MNGDVSDAGPAAGKREAFEHRESARHQLQLSEAGKPKIEIEFVGHEFGASIVNPALGTEVIPINPVGCKSFMETGANLRYDLRTDQSTLRSRQNGNNSSQARRRDHH